MAVFMWQRKIVNYKYLFEGMTRHINVAYRFGVCVLLISLSDRKDQKLFVVYHPPEHMYCHRKMSHKICSCRRRFSYIPLYITCELIHFKGKHSSLAGTVRTNVSSKTSFCNGDGKRTFL